MLFEAAPATEVALFLLSMLNEDICWLIDNIDAFGLWPAIGIWFIKYSEPVSEIGEGIVNERLDLADWGGGPANAMAIAAAVADDDNNEASLPIEPALTSEGGAEVEDILSEVTLLPPLFEDAEDS